MHAFKQSLALVSFSTCAFTHLPASHTFLACSIVIAPCSLGADVQDTSTGQTIAQHRTKMGPCDALRHNPYNAVSLLGHAQGVVTMWTPNMSTPVIKMLTHKVSPRPPVVLR